MFRGKLPSSTGRGPIRFGFPVKVKVERKVKLLIPEGNVPAIDASFNVLLHQLYGQSTYYENLVLL